MMWEPPPAKYAPFSTTPSKQGAPPWLTAGSPIRTLLNLMLRMHPITLFCGKRLPWKRKARTSFLEMQLPSKLWYVKKEFHCTVHIYCIWLITKYYNMPECQWLIGSFHLQNKQEAEAPLRSLHPSATVHPAPENHPLLGVCRAAQH